MKISASVSVLSDQQPRLSWTGTREEAAVFCSLDIRERLDHLITHCRLVSLPQPWQGVKDRTEADRLRQTGMNLVEASKFVEGILEFNSAMRHAPPTVISLLSHLKTD